jgi:hypothetical protein
VDPTHGVTARDQRRSQEQKVTECQRRACKPTVCSACPTVAVPGSVSELLGVTPGTVKGQQ